MGQGVHRGPVPEAGRPRAVSTGSISQGAVLTVTQVSEGTTGREHLNFRVVEHILSQCCLGDVVFREVPSTPPTTRHVIILYRNAAWEV